MSNGNDNAKTYCSYAKHKKKRLKPYYRKTSHKGRQQGRENKNKGCTKEAENKLQNSSTKSLPTDKLLQM